MLFRVVWRLGFGAISILVELVRFYVVGGSGRLEGVDGWVLKGLFSILL